MLGIMLICSPIWTLPASMRPETDTGFCTLPRKTSLMVIRKGRSMACVLGSAASSSSTSVLPVYQLARDMEVRVSKLPPSRPEHGTNAMLFD